MISTERGRDHEPSRRSGPARHLRLVGSREEDALRARVWVHRLAAYREVLLRGSIGLGESYAKGWWDSDDLVALLRILNRRIKRADPIRDRLHRVSPRRQVVRRVGRHDADRDRSNIRAHYDLGNEFFARILDETMMYSCAVFTSPDMTLAEASTEKIDRICEALDLRPHHHLLEIGTGWGGLAVRAAEHFGCRVTTTTISDEQYGYATDRIRAAGLDDRVTVLDQHYRDVSGTYDRIVSIEMIEAVDWRQYRSFFAACDRLLTPDGALAMQAIVLPHQRFERAKHHRDFIKEVIFPGGGLPSIEALLAAATKSSDLTLVGLDDIGLHYVETLRRWRTNLEMCRADLAGLGLDEQFRRQWEFYFAYCEAGFSERYISDVQLLLARPAWRPSKWLGRDECGSPPAAGPRGLRR